MMKKTVKILTVTVAFLIMCLALTLVSSAESIAGIEQENAATPAAIPVNAIQVSGTILWEDENGNTHPARNMKVSIFDNGSLSVITTTNSNGYYSASITSPFGGNSFYIVVETSGLNVTVCDGYGNVCSITSSTYSNAQIGSTVPLSCTFDNETDEGEAASIHQALEMANRFIYSINGSYMNNIEVNFFDHSYYGYSTSEIYIEPDHAFDWDIVQHEYGHYVADYFEIYHETECMHSNYGNMTDYYQSKSGIDDAWDEGFATYFAITVQREMSASSLGISGIGDLVYNDVNIESCEYIYNLNLDLIQGEANAYSVAAILHDLTDTTSISDNDMVSCGVSGIFGMIFDEYCDSISSVASAVDSYYGRGKALDFGYTLTYFQVTPELISPSSFSSSVPPTFIWINQGMSDYPNDKFNLVFFDSDYNQILITPVIWADDDATSESTTSYTLAEAQWNTIKSYAENEDVYCCVRTTQTTSPITGPYYSAPVTITL